MKAGVIALGALFMLAGIGTIFLVTEIIAKTRATHGFSSQPIHACRDCASGCDRGTHSATQEHSAVKHFTLTCRVDEATLGKFMAFALDHSQVIDCSLVIGSEDKAQTMRKSRKGGGKARSKTTEKAVLPLIPIYGAVPIHRKELQKALPQLTRNSIDGALSGLVTSGQIMRTSPGWYTLVSIDPTMVAPYDKT